MGRSRVALVHPRAKTGMESGFFLAEHAAGSAVGSWTDICTLDQMNQTSLSHLFRMNSQVDCL